MKNSIVALFAVSMVWNVIGFVDAGDSKSVEVLRSVTSGIHALVGQGGGEESSSDEDTSYDEDLTDEYSDDYSDTEEESGDSDIEYLGSSAADLSTPYYDPVSKRIIQGSKPPSAKPYNKNAPRCSVGTRRATPNELRKLGRKPSDVICIKQIIRCPGGYRPLTQREKDAQKARGGKQKRCKRLKPKKPKPSRTTKRPRKPFKGFGKKGK